MREHSSYVEDAVYSQLSTLIKSAGISINYEDTDDENSGYPIDNSRIIIMPRVEALTPKEAAIELGKKAGTILAQNTSSKKLEQVILMESEAKKIGVYLYRLADMMVTHQNIKKREKEVLGKLSSI